MLTLTLLLAANLTIELNHLTTIPPMPFFKFLYCCVSTFSIFFKFSVCVISVLFYTVT